LSVFTFFFANFRLRRGQIYALAASNPSALRGRQTVV